jgi:hypothetical protein
MPNFVRRDSEYPRLPALLCEWDAGFASSPEATAIAEHFELPTVVADAFGEYVLRLASTPGVDADVQRALGALERMASHDDLNIQNCAVTGVIERLGSEAPHLIGALGPASADLFKRYGR